jgi:pyruvate,water dikinase
MDWIRPTDSLSVADRPLAGGKAVQLGALAGAGFRVPRGLVLLEPAYQRFVEATGLRGRVMLELGRKKSEAMRWEEMWDAGLRIQHMFARAEWPAEIRSPLAEAVEEAFGETPVAVRSSAPEEDGRRNSFAGVHESFVNVRGADAVLEHVKLVWASLFSDRALLYARELDLDPLRSGMAVVIQELVPGECSGVVFTSDPTDESLVVVEAVHGLNQGLVDGVIEPDRWRLERGSGRIVSHTPPRRERRVVAGEAGIVTEELPGPLQTRPPLSEDHLARLWRRASEVEERLGGPQDLEWTLREDELVLLQARPITTLPAEEVDSRRAWYLSLRRSYENLEALRERVENEHLPAMAREGERLAGIDLSGLGEGELREELERRRGLYHHWHGVYWDEMIPLAHGVRLFAELYNAAVKPEDPFEFVRLLEHSSLRGVERNERLQALAVRLVASGDSEQGWEALDPETREELDDLLARFGGAFEASEESRADWVRLLRRMARRAGETGAQGLEGVRELESRFVEGFPEAERDRARGILDLARASYRLRDDDNLYLGRLEAHVRAAETELERRGGTTTERSERAAAEGELALTAARLGPRDPDGAESPEGPLLPRQLLGHAAGPGVARGRARVILGREDLFRFEEDELLVCDAVDPNMTFVVPLARAVVERRGGMLIHGAIIAREYGLPCVTGIEEATARIRTGDEITVDGYLGIVTVHSSGRRASV